MKKIKIFLITGIFSLVFVLSADVGLWAADVLLGVPLKAQEHDLWCWAGSDQAVLEYYSAVVSQCEIANWAWERSDCCGNPIFSWSHPCNKGNSLFIESRGTRDILEQWGGVYSYGMADVLSQSACVSEIDAGRPFLIRFGWSTGGGHQLAAHGYDLNGQYLDYMDPWPGYGYTKSLYSWVVGATDHAWTHALQLTTNPVAYNLTPYKHPEWPDKIVVSNVSGTKTDSSPLYATDTLYVDWAVINNGMSPISATFYTTLYVDGTQKISWYMDGLKAGYYAYITDYSIGSLSAGQHTIKIVTDSTGVVSESGKGEGDNEYSKTITVIQPFSLPNLTPYQPSDWADKVVVSNVSGTKTDSSPLYETDTLYIDWAVKNNGMSAISARFYATLYVDGTQKISWYMDGLNAGYYASISDYSIGSLSAGQHTVKIVADSTGVVTEGNKGDNEYSKPIMVNLKCPDLPVKRAGLYYSNLQAAYDAAAIGDTIQSQVKSLTGNLNVYRNISVTFLGGYDCSYLSCISNSVVTGRLMISNGTVILSNITIQ